MALAVLVVGESGTGKSASMRNFRSNELALVNVVGKPLPFRGYFENISSDSYREIKKFMRETDKKTIVIDDAQYLMANEFMRRAMERGYDKFTEIAQNFWDLIRFITNELPDDVIVFALSHIERDAQGNEKIKTIGKMLDEKITVEGMFTIVLKTLVKDGVYMFSTRNSGADTVKTPMGLFNIGEIDNDLKAVDTAIRAYYETDIPFTNHAEDAAAHDRELDAFPAEPTVTQIIGEGHAESKALQNDDYGRPTINPNNGEVMDEQPKRRTRRTRQ